MKVCKKCGTAIDIGRCKECNRRRASAYYYANIDRSREKSREYQRAHRDERIAYSRAYYAANREKSIAISKAWAAANIKTVQENRRKWRAANLEKARAGAAQYRRDHPEAKRISEQNRRQKARENGGRLSRGLAGKLFKLQKGKCACCGLPLGDDYHLDHIMPLHRGGQHADSNMQLLRSKCNHEKHAKHPVDFMQERGFLL